MVGYSRRCCPIPVRKYLRAPRTRPISRIPSQHAARVQAHAPNDSVALASHRARTRACASRKRPGHTATSNQSAPIDTHPRHTARSYRRNKCISAATIPFSNKYLLDPVRGRWTEVFPADLDRGGGSSGGRRRVHLHRRLISGHRQQLQAQLRQLIVKWQSVRAPLAYDRPAAAA